MQVFTYWERKDNAPIPYHIQVCLASITHFCNKFGHQHHHLTPENLHEWVPATALNPRWKDLTEIAYRADCIRAAVLALHGGLWVDADTVMVDNPGRIMDDRSEDIDFLCCRWTKPPLRVLNGYVYAGKDSELAKKWLEGVNNRLEKGDIRWCDLGEGILTPLVTNFRPLRGCKLLNIATFLPIEVDKEVELYFTTETWQKYLRPWTVAFGLNNSWMMARKRRMMTEAAFNSRILLIHRLVEDIRLVLTEEERVLYNA